MTNIYGKAITVGLFALPVLAFVGLLYIIFTGDVLSIGVATVAPVAGAAVVVGAYILYLSPWVVV